MITYFAKGYNLAPRPMISSVRIETRGGHDIIHVWNRGGKAGELTVDAGDGLRIALLLLPDRERMAEAIEQ